MRIEGSQKLVLATVIAPVLWAGVQGPDVASNIQKIAFNQQEQPDLGRGITFNPGRQGPNVASGIGRILTTQELPDLGSFISNRGIQGPNVASGILRVIPAQESPYHPNSYTLGSFFPPPAVVVSAGVRSVVTTQEQPDAKAPVLGSGIQGPNVASSIGRILTTQEQPDQPGQLLRASYISVPSVVVSAGTRGVFTTQEQPPQLTMPNLIVVSYNFNPPPVGTGIIQRTLTGVGL